MKLPILDKARISHTKYGTIRVFSQLLNTYSWPWNFSPRKHFELQIIKYTF